MPKEETPRRSTRSKIKVSSNKVSKVSKPRIPRQLVEANLSGPIVSRNRPVGGESGVCENNRLNTLIYEYGPESWVFNTYLPQFTSEQLLWFFFDDSYKNPSDPEYTPSVSNPTEENSYQVVVIKKYKFTDGSKHDVLGVRVPTNNKQGYIDYKIKFAPKPPLNTTKTLVPFYFYIEEFEGPGLPMRKKWGDIATALSPEEHDSIYGNATSFGKKRKIKKHIKHSELLKLNSDIRYLLKL